MCEYVLTVWECAQRSPETEAVQQNRDWRASVVRQNITLVSVHSERTDALFLQYCVFILGRFWKLYTKTLSVLPKLKARERQKDIQNILIV